MFIRSVFLLLASLCLFTSAYAASCPEYQADWRDFSGPWRKTKAEACADLQGKTHDMGGGRTSTITSSKVNSYSGCDLKTKEVFPDGPPAVGDESITLGNRINPTCTFPDNCASARDKVSVVNFTAGWFRDDNLDTPVGPVTAPGVSYQFACVAGCKVAIGDPSTQSAWVSLVPSPAGLYRGSIDSEVVGMGESCTETTPAANPAAPYMPCPGFIGQVNGKTTCVGTASNPLPAGSGDTKPTRDAQNPNDSKGNPTAGSKPGSGEGSGSGGPGRTPSAGNGTAAGGPSGAAGGSGPKPDGTNDKPAEGKEQAACGAPGQPPCKLDESGTPKKFDGDSKGLEDWKTKMEANRDQIKDSGDGIFGGMSIFFSAPPVAGCSPYELPRDMGSIDPCGVADGVRAVMAYIWALGGLFLCIGWIREAV